MHIFNRKMTKENEQQAQLKYSNIITQIRLFTITNQRNLILYRPNICYS